jgi:ribosomal protein S18 acetylase RimI-like enzyme
MIKNLTSNDYEAVKNIISELHKMHVENQPDFYLENECPITLKEYKSLLKKKEKISIAFVVNNKIAGICLATIKNRIEKSIYIDDIFVLSEYRRQGIATKFFEQIKEISKDIGAKRIDLTVWQFNKGALDFYKSLGMKEQRTVLETRLE